MLRRSLRWSICPDMNKNLQTVVQPVSGRFSISSLFNSLTTNNDRLKHWLWLVLPFACVTICSESKVHYDIFFSMSLNFWRPDFWAIAPSEQSSSVSVTTLSTYTVIFNSSPVILTFWSEEAWLLLFDYNCIIVSGQASRDNSVLESHTNVLCECISFCPTHTPVLLKPL